jgi:hypothetical protein
LLRSGGWFTAIYRASPVFLNEVEELSLTPRQSGNINWVERFARSVRWSNKGIQSVKNDFDAVFDSLCPADSGGSRREDPRRNIVSTAAWLQSRLTVRMKAW